MILYRGWRWSKNICPVVLMCSLLTPLFAQTFTTLANFDGTNGDNPYSLIQGLDANGYGVSVNGGASNYGVIFAVTSTGMLTTLHSFSGTDGSYPYSALALTLSGNSYGATLNGGANSCSGNGTVLGCGTIFKITPTATLSTLYNFAGSDGAFPWALIQADDGNFYGVTTNGGTNACVAYGGGGCGTVFKITPAGTLTTLYNFCSQASCVDGRTPASIIEGSDGNFYGTTDYGGNNSCFGLPNQCGIVFKIAPSGTLTVLHSFGESDGAYPLAALFQANDGNLYGTTYSGGVNGDGTIFKITPKGTLTTLFNFHGTDGTGPQSPLIQAADGNFYGTTTGGGASLGGTIFKFKRTLTVLHSFDSTEGTVPVAMMQATDGSFFGVASQGGTNTCATNVGCGTVFKLSVGLGPFVKTLPTSGSIGAEIDILGSNLSRSTSVTFNGTPATFTVKSPTLLTTTVPKGAKTGLVEVLTPSGRLVSNVKFIVR